MTGSTVERLPAYAPELNPAEYLWANLKGRELANYGDTIAEVADQAQHGIQRVLRPATAWWSGSSPTPDCPSTMNRHPNVKGSISSVAT